jgi:hypothetical protein
VSKSSDTSQPLAVQLVYLAASAINSLIRALPAGTAYFIGILLITMFTGQLVHHRGSLARAALPYVVHLRWGWHRVERVMERGKVSLDALFDRAFTWCFECLPVAPVRSGRERRTIHAIDPSTVVRLRANKKRCALLGKGYYQRARRAMQANIVAALTSVVLIRGIRVGVARRTRFGATCQEAVAQVFAALPESPEQRLSSVDAGIAIIEQFRAATVRAALVGRLRKNVTLRRAPHPKRPGKRGRPARHGPLLHPGGQATRRIPGRRHDDPHRGPRGESATLTEPALPGDPPNLH